MWGQYFERLKLILIYSEGENQKRSNSGSPENDEKNTKLRESKVSMTERNNHSNSNMRNQNEKHITINVTSKQQDEFHTTVSEK